MITERERFLSGTSSDPKPAADDRHLHQPKVIVGDDVDLGRRLFARFKRRRAGDVEELSHSLSSKGMFAPMAAASTPGKRRTRSTN